MPNALQVPVQALAEVKGHYFTLAENGDQYETREIKIGSTNDKVATIESGLKEGDEVVMNPRSAGSLLKLPNLPDPTPVVTDEIKRNEPGESPVIVAGAGGKGRWRRRAWWCQKEFCRYDPCRHGGTVLGRRHRQRRQASKDEIAKMDERTQQRLATADTNSDGFLEKANCSSWRPAKAKMKGKGGGGGGGGSGGGGRRGGGEGGPPGGADRREGANDRGCQVDRYHKGLRPQERNGPRTCAA